MSNGFPIDRFMDGSGKVDLSDIDWSEVPKYELTPEAIRTLTYFLKTEGSTFFYVKALMKTKASVEEPDVAPFLCVWMYEEEFHGRAFKKFLQAYGVDVPDSYRAEMFANRSAGERVDELGQTVLSRIFPGGVARRPHDVGRRPGVHDVLRLPGADRSGEPPRPERHLPAHHEAGAQAHGVLQRPGEAPPGALKDAASR
jgi:hypothetical protein